MDQGEACCLETKDLLEKGGIFTVGVGIDLNDAARILISNLKEESWQSSLLREWFSVATESTAGAILCCQFSNSIKFKKQREC